MTERDQEGSWDLPRSGGENVMHIGVTAWSGHHRFAQDVSEAATMSRSAARRSVRYWILGSLFLEQPTEPMLRELALALRDRELGSGDSPARFAALEHSIDAALISPRDFASLRAEFVRLLRGATRPAGRHERAGFEAARPDHLGTELRLMSHLCHSEGEAWRVDDETEARSLQKQEARVLEEHLLPWLPGLCDQFSALARHPFYQAMPMLAAEACTRDRETLARLIHTGTRSMRQA